MLTYCIRFGDVEGIVSETRLALISLLSFISNTTGGITIVNTPPDVSPLPFILLFVPVGFSFASFLFFLFLPPTFRNLFVCYITRVILMQPSCGNGEHFSSTECLFFLRL